MDSTQGPDPDRADALDRLRLVAVGLLIGLGIAIVLLAMAANERDDAAQTVGGDFPAFYGAARIAADGDWESLHDFERQVAAQADLQREEGSARFFAYPPQVALALAPLANFDYGTAYVIHTLVMFLCLLAAIRLAAPMIPWLARSTWVAAAVAMSFWPMFQAVTGGSNTAMTLLVIVAVWRLIATEEYYFAGLVLSLLLAKPQIAAPLVGLILILGLWRAVAGVVTGSIVFYLVGVVLAGWEWPLDWWRTASNFGQLDSEINGFSSVSWLGFLENALGVGDAVAVTVGWGLAGLTSVALVWLWRRHGLDRLPALLAVAMPAILLLSPHAMSHETGLILLTVAVLHDADRMPVPLFAVVWALGWSQSWIQSIGFSPGFFMLLLIGWWTLTRLGLAGAKPDAGRPVAETAAR